MYVIDILIMAMQQVHSLIDSHVLVECFFVLFVMDVKASQCNSSHLWLLETDIFRTLYILSLRNTKTHEHTTNSTRHHPEFFLHFLVLPIIYALCWVAPWIVIGVLAGCPAHFGILPFAWISRTSKSVLVQRSWTHSLV